MANIRTDMRMYLKTIVAVAMVLTSVVACSEATSEPVPLTVSPEPATPPESDAPGDDSISESLQAEITAAYEHPEAGGLKKLFADNPQIISAPADLSADPVINFVGKSSQMISYPATVGEAQIWLSLGCDVAAEYRIDFYHKEKVINSTAADSCGKSEIRGYLTPKWENGLVPDQLSVTVAVGVNYNLVAYLSEGDPVDPPDKD